MFNKINKESTYIVFVIIAYLILQFFYQDLISIRNGRVWDARSYCRMAETLNFKSVKIHYRSRILLPIILHYVKISSNTVKNYFFINIIFTFLFMFYFYKTLRKIFINYDFRVIFYTWLLVITSELSVARLVFFYPASTDPLHLFITIFTLYNIVNIDNLDKVTFKNYLLFFSLFFLGTLNRENFPSNLLLFGYVLLVYGQQNNKIIFIRDSRIIKIILFSILGLVLASVIIKIYTGSWIFTDKERAFLSKLPWHSIIDILASFINSYGVLFLFFVNSSENTPRSAFNHISLLGLIVTFIIGIGGGSNIERFLYWGIFYLVFLVMPHLNNLFVERRYLKLILITIVHIILQRVFFPIYHNGLGMYTSHLPVKQFRQWIYTDEGKPFYSLVEVFTGKGPAMIYWGQLSTNQMEINLITMYVVVVLIVYLIDIRFEFKTLKS